MTNPDYPTTPCPPLLLREPPRSFPFVTDGQNVYAVENWRAERPHGSRLRVRRLTPRQSAILEEALLDAAEEAAYRLSGRARPRRRGQS